MGPLFPDTGPRGARLKRRVRSVAVEVALFSVATLLMPLLLAGAAVVDLVLWLVRRKPWMAVRLVLFAWEFLFGELRGLAGLLVVWARSAGRDTAARRRRIYELRRQWSGGHWDAVVRLFKLDVVVEGLEDVAPGPVVILSRHASIIDNTLPDALIGREHGIGLRFVLKRELQTIPTIDIGGRWVPTTFVRRASGDTAAELVELRRLAHDMDPDEGILIYPEGTRHTDAKLARAKAIIAERQPEVAPLAGRLRHVLPPRLGGPLALLDAGRGHDVVFCGHVGLDGFEYIRDIWAGGLVGGTVRVKFWRHPAASVPQDRDELTRWLYDGWQVLDDWVGEHRRDPGVVTAG